VIKRIYSQDRRKRKRWFADQALNSIESINAFQGSGIDHHAIAGIAVALFSLNVNPFLVILLAALAGLTLIKPKQPNPHLPISSGQPWHNNLSDNVHSKYVA